MIIDLNSRVCEQKKITTNLILIEDISNIDRNLLKSGFTYFFRNIGDSYWEFKRQKENGTESLIACRPIFTFNNLASDDLSSLFNSKKLSTIKLIKKKTTGLGESFISQEESTITYKISKNTIKQSYDNFIDKILKQSKDNGYSIIKFNYKDDNDQNITATFSDINSQRLSSLEAAYSKKEIIKTDIPIKQCEDNFHYELHKKMKAILLKEIIPYDIEINENINNPTQLHENFT